MRWPGGNFVSAYHWIWSVGDRDERPSCLDPAWNLWESNDVGTDEFMEMCRLVETEPILTINMGNGTVEEAAAWVEWLPILRDAGVPAGRINTIDQALGDEHLKERGMIVELEHPALGLVKSIATPIHMSETPLVYCYHPPRLGEHTSRIMMELGYDEPWIQYLRE